MININFFKRAAVLLLLFYTGNILAQGNIGQTKFIFKNQLRVSITGALYDNLELNNVGQQLLKSKTCVSGEAIVSFYQHIIHGFGLNFGFGLSIAPFNYNFNFESPPGSIFQTGPYKEDYKYLSGSQTTYIQDLYIFPISVQKIIPIKKTKNLYYNLELGIKMNIKTAFPYEISSNNIYVIDDSTEVNLLDFYLYDTGKRNFISYFLKIGILKVTKKDNSLNYNLVFHYSPQNIGSGWYRFYELNFDSYGTVNQNINYIGIEFKYGLTLSKRKIVK